MMTKAADEVTGTSLTSADRCDRCGAQAFVRVVLESGDLLFCGHHYARYSEALRGSARSVEDHTHLLQPTN